MKNSSLSKTVVLGTKEIFDCFFLDIILDLVILGQHVNLESESWDEENNFQITHAN